MLSDDKQNGTINQIEEDYKVFKVRSYIKNNPKCSKNEIEKRTGVSVKEIDRFIDEGKNEYKEQDLNTNKNGIVDEEKRSKFLEQLKYQQKMSKRYEDTGSKLVRDLEKKHREEMGR